MIFFTEHDFFPKNSHHLDNVVNPDTFNDEANVVLFTNEMFWIIFFFWYYNRNKNKIEGIKPDEPIVLKIIPYIIETPNIAGVIGEDYQNQIIEKDKLDRITSSSIHNKQTGWRTGALLVFETPWIPPQGVSHRVQRHVSCLRK